MVCKRMAAAIGLGVRLDEANQITGKAEVGALGRRIGERGFRCGVGVRVFAVPVGGWLGVGASSLPCFLPSFASAIDGAIH